MTDLIDRARRGDAVAFELLVEPHRRELQVHCYRMLGSLQDSEDALQETLLAAWRAFGRFEARASVRTWLYQIATNRCLNALRSARRRPSADMPAHDVPLPEPTRLGEVHWIQPYPDALLEGVADAEPGPDARIESREAISLAFVTALQHLPPLQRAVVVLRDVLGYPAKEVAGLLETTEESVTSALEARPCRAATPRTGTLARALHRRRGHRPSARWWRGSRRHTSRETSTPLFRCSLTTSSWPCPRSPSSTWDARWRSSFYGPWSSVPIGHSASSRPGRTVNRRSASTSSIRSPTWRTPPVCSSAPWPAAAVSALIRFDIAVLDRFGLPRTLDA